MGKLEEALTDNDDLRSKLLKCTSGVSLKCSSPICQLKTKILNLVIKFLFSSERKRRLISEFDPVIVSQIDVNIVVNDEIEYVTVSIPFCGHTIGYDEETKLMQMYVNVVDGVSFDQVKAEKKTVDNQLDGCAQKRIDIITLSRGAESPRGHSHMVTAATVFATAAIIIAIRWIMVIQRVR